MNKQRGKLAAETYQEIRKSKQQKMFRMIHRMFQRFMCPLLRKHSTCEA